MPVPRTLPFDQPVRPGGYAWWYVDALSDDGAHGLTIILFVGSVFSPRYAQARRSFGDDPQHTDPERFCAVNVALYDIANQRNVWALTEHPSCSREPNSLQIGASSMRWAEPVGADPAELHIELREHQTRFFGRRGAALDGRIRLRPSATFGPRIELDHWQTTPQHRWYPIVPHARVEVEFDAPQLRFSGSGYHDANEGDEGLERAFRSWNWSRCELGDHSVIAYDVVDLQDLPHARAWRFRPATAELDVIPEHTLGPASALASTRWRVPRAIRSDPGHPPQLRRTLEDSPFYSRSLVDVQLGGQSGVAMHESLSLQRFASKWVRFLLPFKIRRGSLPLAATTSP